MSNLMDPDGTNRIVKQRVTEWYAEMDEGRNATLLDAELLGARWSRLAHVRSLLAAVMARSAALGRRLLHGRPVG